jgi:hypothetical protein
MRTSARQAGVPKIERGIDKSDMALTRGGFLDLATHSTPCSVASSPCRCGRQQPFGMV